MAAGPWRWVCIDALPEALQLLWRPRWAPLGAFRGHRSCLLKTPCYARESCQAAHALPCLAHQVAAAVDNRPPVLTRVQPPASAQRHSAARAWVPACLPASAAERRAESNPKGGIPGDCRLWQFSGARRAGPLTGGRGKACSGAFRAPQGQLLQRHAGAPPRLVCPHRGSCRRGMLGLRYRVMLGFRYRGMLQRHAIEACWGSPSPGVAGVGAEDQQEGEGKGGEGKGLSSGPLERRHRQQPGLRGGAPRAAGREVAHQRARRVGVCVCGGGGNGRKGGARGAHKRRARVFFAELAGSVWVGRPAQRAGGCCPRRRCLAAGAASQWACSVRPKCSHTPKPRPTHATPPPLPATKPTSAAWCPAQMAVLSPQM